jgi:hypothetical protein
MKSWNQPGGRYPPFLRCPASHWEALLGQFFPANRPV